MVEMKRILVYAAVFSLVIADLIYATYANAKTDNNKLTNIDKTLQFYPTRWQLVKQTLQLHIPKNGKALSQLIIEVPPTVAVSNDIDILDDKGQKIKINISVNNKRIIIAFPEPVTSNTTKLKINFNKVLQPIIGSISIYHLSAKVVGSDVEIPVGVARFSSF